MKFDFVIGNPPYQNPCAGGNDAFMPPVYHLFLDRAYEISDKVLMIHPARFLFNNGFTPKDWNKKMLNDRHMKILHYVQDGTELFPGLGIRGGVAITYRDARTSFSPITKFDVFIPHDELESILQKVLDHPHFSPLSAIMGKRGLYKFTEKMYEENPYAKIKKVYGHDRYITTNAFSKFPGIFFDSVPKDGNDYIAVLGRVIRKRTYKYMKASYICSKKNDIYKYKVFISKANGSGTLENVASEPVLGLPGVVSTDTFLSAGVLETEEQGHALIKYVKTKFARALLGVLRKTQSVTGDKYRYVPLQDFTSGSDIDWTESIPGMDRQLYEKYGLDEREIAFIETHVKEML